MSEVNHFTEPPVAYLNADFLKSSEARILRILSEYLEPASRLRHHRVRDTIVFFGSARSLSPEIAALRLESLKQHLAETGTLTPELEAELSRAEYAVKLARYYADAVELARRVTEWSKGLTRQHHFIVCSGGSGGLTEEANRGCSLARGKATSVILPFPFWPG